MVAHHCPIDTSWKGRVRRAAFSCLQYCTAVAEKQVSHDRFCQVFQTNGGVLPVDSQPVQSKWQCDLCQRCFPSKRGLASHAARAHGYKRIERYYAVHATCDACGKYYHARARLLMHLYDCPDCLLTLQACFPPAPEDEVERLDNEGKQYAGDMRTQGWWKTKAFLPPLKIYGPLLPPNTPDAVAFKTKWEARTQTPGTAFQELQGRRAHAEPPEQPQVYLFEDDMPAFVMQAMGFLPKPALPVKPPGYTSNGWYLYTTSVDTEDPKICIRSLKTPRWTAAHTLWSSRSICVCKKRMAI